MAIGELGVRFDPATSHNFLLSFVDSSGSLDGSIPVEAVLAAGFSEVGGLDMTLEVEDYKEGGRNDRVHKLPTRVTWGSLRLKRGVAISDDLFEWLFGFVEGRGTRRDGLITLQDDLKKPVRVWKFVRALPVKWTGPSLDAARSQVAIEELEIAHEGLSLTGGRTLLGLGEVADLAVDAVRGVFDL